MQKFFLPVFVCSVTFVLTSIPVQIFLERIWSEKVDYLRIKIIGSSLNSEYDFVILGGGTAGSILANRLSKHNTVLLLERGGHPTPVASIPYFTLELINLTSQPYRSTTQSYGHLDLGYARLPRGKGLGGSSNLNGMIYIRGSPKVFDDWADIAKDDLWKYENVLPYFINLEDYDGSFQPIDRKFHGTGGPLHIETDQFQPGIGLIEAALREKGFVLRDSSAAGPKDKDFTPVDHNQKNGARHGTYEAYLEPILLRPNLKIITYAEVEKIHLDSKSRASGVSFLHHDVKKFVRTRMEIILSAGTIDSPKILMLSGIGPCHDLRKVGISCKKNLPRVGQNLQDHTAISVFVHFNDSIAYMADRDMRPRDIWDYAFSGKGPFRSLGLVTTAYLSTKGSAPDYPDVQFQFYGGMVRPFESIPKHYTKYRDLSRFTDLHMITVSEYVTKSVGELKLESRRAKDSPSINPNYYKDYADVERTIEGLKTIVQVYEETSTFQKYNANIILLPVEKCDSLPFRSDTYWECHIRHASPIAYHPTGTCSMGVTTSQAVVDSKLRVFEISGLRVIDASVIAKIPNVNIHASVIVVAEIGADLIRHEWAAHYGVSKRPTYWKLRGQGQLRLGDVKCSNFFCRFWKNITNVWNRVFHYFQAAAPVDNEFDDGICFVSRIV